MCYAGINGTLCTGDLVHAPYVREVLSVLSFSLSFAGKRTSVYNFFVSISQFPIFRYLKHIDNGLLYYLKSDQTQVSQTFVCLSLVSRYWKWLSFHCSLVKGISVQRSDLVGLIIRRNELANDILVASTTQQLPPMLRVCFVVQ